MKVMISQPMRGKTKKQIIKEREALTKELEAKGWEVVDTIFADKPPKDSEVAIWYLAKSIEAISKVDAVAFMPGWQDARGCCIEFDVARDYGKFIKYPEI